LYQEANGTVPLLDWLDRLPDKAKDKCTVALGRLAELGHELRRPEAEFYTTASTNCECGFDE